MTLELDLEEIAVAKEDGESWAETAERLRARDDDRWHYCVCGARYRSRGPALRCCSDRFADGEIVTDGGRPAFIDPQTEWVECYICGQHIEDMSRVEGIDISGPEEYYPKMKPVCPDCDREIIDEDDDPTVVTDGGSALDQQRDTEDRLDRLEDAVFGDDQEGDDGE